METPTVSRRTNGNGKEAEQVDGAVGSSNTCIHYSLFLPDPESVDRLRSDPVETVYQSANDDAAHKTIPTNDLPPTVVVDPNAIIPNESIDVSDLVQGSVKSRRRNKTSDRRVQIDDSPPTVRKISPQPYSRLSSGLVSYQLPSGATSRSRSGRRPRESSINERKTMSELAESVRSASDLLERRRLAKKASTSSYMSSTSYSTTSFYPTSSESTRERGREVKRSTVGYSRHSGLSSTSDESPISLRGLLDYAQNWLTSHKSRREVSMERATMLLRRSKHY
jgi:hypothetical protein